MFVENAGWGGKAAASVASLVIEKYLKKRVDNKSLEKKIKEQNFLPSVVLPKQPVKPKKIEPEPIIDSVPRPMMVKNPAQPTSVRPAIQIDTKPLKPRSVPVNPQ